MTRINSDGTLPNSDWNCFSPITDLNWTPLTVSSLKVQKALFIGVDGMPGWFELQAKGAVFARIVAGTSYELTAAPGTTFDLYGIRGRSSDGMDAAIVCMYQP